MAGALSTLSSLSSLTGPPDKELVIERPGRLTADERTGPPMVPVLRHGALFNGRLYLNEGHTEPWDSCRLCNDFRAEMRRLHGISEKEQGRYD